MTNAQEFLRRNLRGIARFLEVAVIAAWLVGQFIPALQNWLQNQGVVELVVVVLVAELIAQVADIQGSLTHEVNLSPDQIQSAQRLINRIGEVRPSTAQLMGLTAGKREDLLNALTRSGWNIQLLIQHPDAAMNDVLKHHLEEKINELVNVTFIHYDKMEIRLFQRPCYLRGTKVSGVAIAVGWYICGEGPYELFGHSNPLVSAEEGTAEAETLGDFFDRAFDYLWNHKETVQAEAYLKERRIALPK